MRKLWFAPALALILLILAACSQKKKDETPIPDNVTPTVAVSFTPSATATPTQPLTSPTPTFPPSLTPSATPTEVPPTPIPGPTNTPGPFEYQIKSGDDCISILYAYGHVDLDALNAFYQLNNMSGCSLPGAGTTVLVPRPTPQGGDVTAEPTVTPYGSPPYTGSYLFPGTYCVVEGDTLTSVALKNDTSLRWICANNPLPDGLDCRGCDFSQSEVGFCPNPPLMVVGKCLTVPAPTPTLTGTPLPTGNETATPTPTHRPPDGVFPPNQTTVEGAVRLQWVSAGLLLPEEFYVVTMTDEVSGATFLTSTKSTYADVPPEYAPTDGQPHSMVWSVLVQMQQPDGLFVPVGGRTPDYRFTWE